MDVALAPPPAVAADDGVVPGWIGARAYDADGARIGHVADVLFDAQSRAPGWVLLVLPRPEEQFVLAPARGLRHLHDGVQLGCRRDAVRTAPTSAGPPDGLAHEHARALARHFGVRCGAGPWHGVAEPRLVGVAGRMRTSG